MGDGQGRRKRMASGCASALALAWVVGWAPAWATAQPVDARATSAVAGVTSYHQVSPTLALSSAVPPASMAALAAGGVTRLIVVRLPTEPNYAAAEAEAAATAAGLAWVAMPFNADAPDDQVVDRVLAELARPEQGSTVIVCRTGQRSALMWFARRVLVDGWDDARAMQEAESLGLVRADLKAFARTYVQARAAAKN